MKLSRLALRWYRAFSAPGMALVLIVTAGCGAKPAPPAAIPPKANAPAAAAPAVAKSTNLIAAETFVSSFDHKSLTGRDPFFPASTRRGEVRVSNTITNTVTKTPTETILMLNSIVGSGSRRVALINNRTFAQGDEVQVRVASGQVRVKCLEIGDKFVTVIIQGESNPKQLFLK